MHLVVGFVGMDIYVYLCTIMSKVSAYYHIVFCTKSRRMVLPLEHCEHLYRFIWKELTDNKCQLLRIGGIQNHVHLLINLHPGISLSLLIQKIKGHSSSWLRRDNRFPFFEGWASEYFATSISAGHKDAVINYIKNQRNHHQTASFEHELKKTLCCAWSEL